MYGHYQHYTAISFHFLFVKEAGMSVERKSDNLREKRDDLIQFCHVCDSSWEPQYWQASDTIFNYLDHSAIEATNKNIKKL